MTDTPEPTAADIAALQTEAGAEFIPFGPIDPTPQTGADDSGEPEMPVAATDRQQTTPEPDAAEVAALPALVASFGAYEAEYATIRKGVGIFHQPHRAMLRIEGADRLDFLQRMLTQDVADLEPGRARRAFLLDHRGRIATDLLVLHDRDVTFLELDRPDAAAVAAKLDSFLFTEDVTIHDDSDTLTGIALHGPAAAKLIHTVTGHSVADLTHLQLKRPGRDGEPAGQAGQATGGGTEQAVSSEPGPAKAADATLNALLIHRYDQTGTPGLHLWLPTTAAASLYSRLADAVGGLNPDIDQSQVREGGEPAPPRREVIGRGIGWLAFNTARIEAGRPLYHIDFGPDTLPHETGLLEETVSFTKGCYLGQEIVARMQHLGRPSKTLIILRFEDDRLPIAGEQVFTPTPAPGSAPAPGYTPASSPESGAAPGSESGRSTGPADSWASAPASGSGADGGGPSPQPPRPGRVVGAITSSTLAPLRGHTAVALAMVKWGHHTPGTQLLAPAEGSLTTATVEPLPS